MALLGLTNAQAKLIKWLIKAGPDLVSIGAGFLASQLVAQGDAEGDPLEWRRFVLQVNRNTPAGTVEDKATFKFDLVNITADEIDNSWTSGDMTSVANAMTTMVNALAPYMASNQTIVGARVYRMTFNDVLDITRPFGETGAPTDLFTFNTAGTAATGLPYQVAPTVTFRTAWAKHWGRIYLPTPGTAHIDAYGRLTSGYRTGAGGVVKAFLGTAHDAGFYPVIPVGQVEKQAFHGLLGVSQVVVDDVPDVQRRRRSKQVLSRSVI